MPCPAGMFSEDESLGAVACVACPSGFVDENVAAAVGQSRNGTNCQACPQGTYFVLPVLPVSGEPSRANVGAADQLCQTCPKGQYSNASGASSCILCPAGTTNIQISDNADNYDSFEDCVACRPGFYSDRPGLSEHCAVCPTAEGQGAVACAGCAPGKRISGDTCRECAPGMYTETRDQTYCRKCARGKYQDQKGHSECQDCPRGMFGQADDGGATNLTTGCSNCPAGKYADQEGLNGIDQLCTPCQAGTWSDAVGGVKEALCKNCKAGTWSEARGQATEDACKLCGAGRFVESVGSDQRFMCEACPKGFGQPRQGSAYCLPCFPGFYSTATGAPACKRCGRGRISRGQNATSCESCARGFYQNTEGGSTCFRCIPGTFASTTGQASCLFCPRGRFQPLRNASFCTRLTAGYVANTGRSSEIQVPDGSRIIVTCEDQHCQPFEACTAGTRSNENRSVCVECEVGMTSSTGARSCHACDRGKYAPAKGLQSCVNCPGGWFQPQDRAPVQ